MVASWHGQDPEHQGSGLTVLVSFGAWGCFDEFNRLIPVHRAIHVCAEQFMSACDGTNAESLVPTCGAFMVMNPVARRGPMVVSSSWLFKIEGVASQTACIRDKE